MLFEKIKVKYLLFRKMRINLVRVDPNKKARKSAAAQTKRHAKK
jgi:hypothetical protein